MRVQNTDTAVSDKAEDFPVVMVPWLFSVDGMCTYLSEAFSE